MPCREQIVSDQTYDYITDFPIENTGDLTPVTCYESIDDAFNIVYLNRNLVPNLEVNFFEYQSIPKLYGLMQQPGGSGANPQVFDPTSLVASGILQVQGQPLNLTGFGTLICFIDTGIDYTNPVFRDAEGNTRIEAIWDQTIQTGDPPEGFLYGTEYTREEINRALQSDDPRALVPSRDENGHGTALASVAAGSVLEDGAASGFRGAAPDAGILVVKLKPAKQYLRDFFLLPPDADAYQENDIMLAVKYCDQFAKLFQRPIVICLGLGTSFGDHSGSSALSTYLNTVAIKRNRAVVVCGGNEGNAAHHFRGNLNQSVLSQPAGGSVSQDVEIRVAEGNNGFFLELWGKRPDVLNVSIRSPGGETIPPIPLGLRQSITYGFIYERTQVTVDSTLVEPSSGDELILLRFVQPTPGIWNIRVISQRDVQNGIFDLWLPITRFQQGGVYFLSPNPDITLTEPAMASEVIAVSTYNAINAGFYIDSGRGFSRSGLPRPDLSAPGVDISTISGKRSGSGYAAAITAGAVAQFFQWAVVEKNNQFAESREIKSYLIRGAKRNPDIIYPSKEWGYGRLDIAGVFTSLRV